MIDSTFWGRGLCWSGGWCSGPSLAHSEPALWSHTGWFDHRWRRLTLTFIDSWRQDASKVCGICFELSCSVASLISLANDRHQGRRAIVFEGAIKVPPPSVYPPGWLNLLTSSVGSVLFLDAWLLLSKVAALYWLFKQPRANVSQSRALHCYVGVSLYHSLNFAANHSSNQLCKTNFF